MKKVALFVLLIGFTSPSHAKPKTVQVYAQKFERSQKSLEVILKPLMLKIDMACRYEVPPELQSIRINVGAMKMAAQDGYFSSDFEKQARREALEKRTDFLDSREGETWIARRAKVRQELTSNLSKTVKELVRLSTQIRSISPVPKGLRKIDEKTENSGYMARYIVLHLPDVVRSNNSTKTDDLLEAYRNFQAISEDVRNDLAPLLNREDVGKVYQ